MTRKFFDTLKDFEIPKKDLQKHLEVCYSLYYHSWSVIESCVQFDHPLIALKVC